MKIIYLPIFVRQYKKLEPNLQNEVGEKISLFQKDAFHPFLKTHKLKGRLKDRWSFSVNYQYRIVFIYLSNKEVAFLAVGDHSIYD